MWKLVIEDDEGVRTEVRLTRDEYAIGRAAGNSIRLTDWNVSREHAVLRRVGETYEIEDLDSFNGTHLNGARVNVPRALADGDVVQVGDYVFALEPYVPPPAREEPLAQAPAPPVQPARAAVRREARLCVLEGVDIGKEYPLDGDDLVIGRKEGVDIALTQTSVSRRHCRLVRIEGGRFDVTDLGSSNGIVINGVELRRGVLEPGDTLRVGDVALRYVAADEVYWPPARGDRASKPGRASVKRAFAAFIVVVVAAIVLAVYLGMKR